MKFELSDIHLLPFQSIPNRKLLPAVGAVYFVISETGKLLYVGSSKDIRRRWKQHDIAADIDRPKLAKIYYLEITDLTERGLIEKELILKFRPSLNWLPIVQRPKPIVEPVKSIEASPDKPIKLKAKDLAEKFGVNRRVALGWFERGLFPTAQKMKGEFFEYWEVDENDIKDFVPQKRKGKPSKKSIEPAPED